MKKNISTIILSITAFLIFSCDKEKELFGVEVLECNIIKVSPYDAFNLKITNSYLKEKVEVSSDFYYSPCKIWLGEYNYKYGFKEKEYKYSQSCIDSMVYLERLEYAKKINLTSIQSNIILKNLSDQILEDSYLTSCIIFEFDNKKLNYIHFQSLLNNDEIWKPNEKIDVTLKDFIHLYENSNNSVLVHTPNKVIVNYYLHYSNSVGFNNANGLNFNDNYSRFLSGASDNYGRQDLEKELKFGKFFQGDIEKKGDSLIGRKIKELDITNLWVDYLKEKKDCYTYDLMDIARIKVSKELELRNSSSNITKKMNSYRNEYNEVNQNKIGKSNLVFQPVGTDINDVGAFSDLTRLLIKHKPYKNSETPKWNEKIDNLALNEFEKVTKKITKLSINEMDPDAILIKWNKPISKSLKTGQVYIKFSFVHRIFGENTYVETYYFFNKDEAIEITFMSDYPVKQKWRKIVDDAINSFSYKSRK